MSVRSRRANILEPYEAFYAALDKCQKALLEGLGPSRGGCDGDGTA